MTTTTKRAPRRPATPRPVVPGARGIELAEPLTVYGTEWAPADGDGLAGCPIGAALAKEHAKKASAS